jgi:rhodanese-related sulfurtransferase/glyoxylase-like metal-dependent hydrolase (beta-lactamase superfamily II)
MWQYNYALQPRNKDAFIQLVTEVKATTLHSWRNAGEALLIIVAGALLLLGALPGAFVSPRWLLLSGFVGVGLTFAGLTRTCGMAYSSPGCRITSASQAHKRGIWRIRYVLETHVHNDYLSGALEVHRATGAEIGVPAQGGYAFPHVKLAEGDTIRLGALHIVALEIPGHTWEHTFYVVHEDNVQDPVVVFTGGSLIVGSSGRTDLLGDEYTDPLTRAQYHTLKRLLCLPDTTQVLPTHGAGSFCTAAVPSMERTTTIGQERQRNPALDAADEEAFLRERLTGLLAYPAYYVHMAPLNRQGPTILERLPGLASLTPEQVAQQMHAGAWLVDARNSSLFAQAHVPGSVNIALDATFGTYVGWTVPFNSSLILILPEPLGASAEQAVTQLIRIGFDRLAGFLAGGVNAWRAGGRPLRTYPTATVDDLCHAYLEGQVMQVLDVRQPAEFQEGHVPGSINLFVGDLPQRVQEIPKNTEIWVACAGGRRASIAASFLDRAGLPVRLIAQGGIPEWLAHCMPRQRGT